MYARRKLIPAFLLAAALLAGSPVSASPGAPAVASESLTASAAPSLLNARVRVVKVSATSVTLDVFDTDAQATGPAKIALGRRSTFSTRGATLNGKPWSSSWRSVRKDSMLMVQASVTPKSGSCSVVPEILGDRFCVVGSNYSPLTRYTDLKLVSADSTNGYCASGSKYRTNKWGWTRFSPSSVTPSLCFFEKNETPTGVAYISSSWGFHTGKTEVLVETSDKSLYFSLPVMPGAMPETKLDRLPARRSKIRIAIAADFMDDGDGVESSSYKTVTLPR